MTRGDRRGTAKPALVLAAILMAGVGCAPSMFQRHIEARRWAEAAGVFATDSALHHDDDALYRAAVLHSMPGTPVYNPALARTLLDRLLIQHPRSGRQADAEHLRTLVLELERAAARDRRERELEHEILRLGREITDLYAARDSLHALLASEAARQLGLRQAVDRLEGDLRQRDHQLRALRTELDRLKAIDLRHPERPDATTPPPGEGVTQPLPGPAARGRRRSRRRRP
jgi:hypothetical protein